MSYLHHTFVRDVIRGQLKLCQAKHFHDITDMVKDYERIGTNSLVGYIVKSYAKARAPLLDSKHEIIEENEVKEWLIYLIDDLNARPYTLENSIMYPNIYSLDFMKTFIDRDEKISLEHFQYFMSDPSIPRWDRWRLSEYLHSRRLL